MNESRIFVRDIKENRKHDGGGECDKTIRIKTVEMYITLNLSTRRGNRGRFEVAWPLEKLEEHIFSYSEELTA